MAGLLDFLQAASNSAASNVSGPVDGLAWLLRKAGIDVGEPVGGSAWMERQGLTRPVKQSGASLAGETAGLLAPIAAAAKAPQIAKGLLQMADNAAAPRALRPDQGAIVWHGSPHKFDRFDSSKIGTGEGAQAYGHGLYLAESKDLADVYRKKLTGVDGAAVSHPDHSLQVKIGQLQNQIQQLRQSDNPAAASMIRAYENRIAELNSSGSLYKVDLPDNAIAKMLDWDKPLSQQAPEVRAAAEALGVGKPYLAGMPAKEIEAQGMQMYSDLSRRVLGSKALADAEAAKKLRELGIPGIRYLDGGSRGAGTGTSNFVVFPGEDSLLTILERNGIPLR